MGSILFGKSTWKVSDVDEPAPVSAPGLHPVAEPAKGTCMELEATRALFQPSPPVTEPAFLPSAVPDLEQGLLCCVWELGAEPQTVGSSACLGIFSPALQLDT